MIHAIFAVFFQVLVGILTRNWWVGGVVATTFFVAREITQAEYRWIEHIGDGTRASMPLWGGLDPQAWNVKSIFDFVLPAAAVLIVYLVYLMLRSRRR